MFKVKFLIILSAFS